MPAVVIDIDSVLIGAGEAKAQLAWMEHALNDMHEPIEGIVADIHRQTLAAFASHGSAIGQPWEALAASTVREKAQAGFPEWPLVRTGAMMASATSSEGPYSVGETLEHQAWLSLDWERDGWNIPALHQLGVPWRLVTQHRRHKDGSGYTVTYAWHLPSRPFWQATDYLANEGADRIERWIWGPGVF